MDTTTCMSKALTTETFENQWTVKGETQQNDNEEANSLQEIKTHIDGAKYARLLLCVRSAHSSDSFGAASQRLQLPACTGAMQ